MNQKDKPAIDKIGKTDNLYYITCRKGGDKVAFRNVTVINGVKKELSELDEKDRRRLMEELTRRAAAKVGYEEVQKEKERSA